MRRGTPSDTTDERSATDGALLLTSPAHSRIRVDTKSWLTATDPTQTHEPIEKSKSEALTKPKDDFVALFATKAYESLYISRPLLKDVVELFLKEPRFRERMRRQLHPPKYTPRSRPRPTFRLMDLPVELRTQIAEYAMHKFGGITWIRRQSDEDVEQRVSGFEELVNCFGPPGSVASLTVVSKQLRKETYGLLFKVNILNFPDDSDDSFIPAGFAPGVADYLFSRSKVHVSLVESIRSFSFTVDGINFIATIEWIGRFDSFAEIPHDVAIRLEMFDWYVEDEKKKAADAFMNKGHETCSLLQYHGFLASERRWRMFPTILYDLRDLQMSCLKKWLSSEDLQLALHWIDNGT